MGNKNILEPDFNAEGGVNFMKNIPSNFHEMGNKTRKTLYWVKGEKKDLQNTIKALKANYIGDELTKRTNDATDKLSKHLKEVGDDLRIDLADLTAQKYRKIQEMTETPPTDNQLRLLDCISRRTTLSQYEVGKYGEALRSNYNAVAALRDIAFKAGVKYYLPAGMNPEQLEKDLESVNIFLKGAIDDMEDVSRLDPSPEYTEFFIYNDNKPDEFYEPKFITPQKHLDNAELLDTPKTEKVALNPMEESTVNYYMGDLVNESPMSNDVIEKVDEIVTNHPEVAELMEHTKFKNAVETVKQKRETEAAAAQTETQATQTAQKPGEPYQEV